MNSSSGRAHAPMMAPAMGMGMPMMGMPPPNMMGFAPAPAPAPAAFDPLAGLFGGPSVPATNSAPAAAAGGGDMQKFPPMTVFQKNGLTITFALRKPAPDKTQIMATFTNASGSELSNLDFKVAVPKV